MSKITSSKKDRAISLGACAIIAVIGVSLLRVRMHAQPQLAGTAIPIPRPDAESLQPATDITGETLQETEFRTSTAAAVSSGAPVPIFSPGTISVVCPDVAGNTCTFYVLVQAQTGLTPGDSGSYRFLVDGQAPNPGPTESDGFVSWGRIAGFFSSAALRSYAVVARVTNTSEFQDHSIEVDVACPQGCGSAATNLASLRIDVFLR